MRGTVGAAGETAPRALVESMEGAKATGCRGWPEALPPWSMRLRGAPGSMGRREGRVGGWVVWARGSAAGNRRTVMAAKDRTRFMCTSSAGQCGGVKLLCQGQRLRFREQRAVEQLFGEDDDGVGWLGGGVHRVIGFDDDRAV